MGSHFPSSQPLVPLGTSLFPPSLVYAFGLPSLSDGPSFSGAPPPKFMPGGSVPPENRKPTSPVYITQPPTIPPYNWPMHLQQKPFLQGHQPTTSGSNYDQPVVGLTNSYGMCMPYPPQFASSFPNTLLQQTRANGTVADYSSLSFSGGHCQQQNSGGGMRSNAATTTTMTDTTDEDQGDGARAVKRARLVWTPQLHKRFEEAVAKLGHEKSIPKNIMQEMNVEGLTRENVASHLQKFRMLQRPQGGVAPVESGSNSGDKEKGIGTGNAVTQ